MIHAYIIYGKTLEGKTFAVFTVLYSTTKVFYVYIFLQHAVAVAAKPVLPVVSLSLSIPCVYNKYYNLSICSTN